MRSDNKLVRAVGALGALALVIMLSAVFVVEFGGPQSEGFAAGLDVKYAARIDDETITEAEFKAHEGLSQQLLARMGSLFGYSPSTAKQRVLDGLVERILMAREARALGLRVSDEDLAKPLQEGRAYVTLPDQSNQVAIPVLDRDGKFDRERAIRYIQNGLHLTEGEYLREQREEILAHRLRGIVRATVTVSPNEVWDAYVAEKETAKLEYVRFSADFYGENLASNKTAVKAWWGLNKDAVDKAFEQEGQSETEVPEDERKQKIAERLYREQEGAAAAERAGKQALAKLQKGDEMLALDEALRAEFQTSSDAEPAPLAPQRRETRAFGRSASPIAGPFNSRPLADLAFELSLEEPVAKETVKLGRDTFVVRLLERESASKKDFTDEVKQRIRDGLLASKSREVLAIYVAELHERATEAGSIDINAKFVATFDKEES